MHENIPPFLDKKKIKTGDKFQFMPTMLRMIE